ncbi:hypothetical protein BLA6860_03852 [Burkholderia lata]|nr:hypothetical protein BLA6860_03852 [Burkholderia lata]
MRARGRAPRDASDRERRPKQTQKQTQKQTRKQTQKRARRGRPVSR